MPNLKTLFAEYRERALADPMTRANRLVPAEIEIGGGIAMGLSVNL